MKDIWLKLSDGLEVECAQAREEGRALDADTQQEIEETLKMENGDAKSARAVELFERVQRLPYVGGTCKEPDVLADIQAAAPGNAPLHTIAPDEIYNKVYGAWLGRAAGCLLGKPVEGWRTPALSEYLKLTKNDPIHAYFRGDVDEDIKNAVRAKAGGADLFAKHRTFIERVDCMPIDDDTNYTTLALKLLEKDGRDFTPDNVADCWLGNLPIYACCTAERVAYRNLVMGKRPPESARYVNGYREWIGAQIRADTFGYVNPADPRTAADMAWRDASISHVKNGIYGEMWVAAMLAAAYVTDDIEAIIRIGLNEVPSESRLTRAVEDALSWHASGISAEDAMRNIHARWNEFDAHHWCHTISNAQIVVTALIYGDMDLEKSLGLAVAAGFDTDCNGATVGSVLGMRLGAKALPEKWIAPLNDTMLTSVADFERVRISDMARRTQALAETGKRVMK